jgi:hypothetical protein
LDKAILLIGRGSDCDVILLHSRKISRHHCCIAQVDNSYVIRDLGSMNGIRVNGARVRESRMGKGDEVSIGDLVFTFEFREKAATQRGMAPRSAPVLANPVPRPRVVLIQPEVASNLSQEIPIAIPEPSAGRPADDFSRETPKQAKRVTFPPFDSGAPDHGIGDLLKLDSGEIELRKLSDSEVR